MYLSRKDLLSKNSYEVGLSLHTSQVAHQAGAYPGLRSMKRLGILLLPLDGMLVHRMVPIYTPGWREAL